MQPFASVLIDANGEILFENHNHAVTGDPTQHPEWGLPTGPLAPLPINAVAPNIPGAGPDPTLTGELREIFAHRWGVDVDA